MDASQQRFADSSTSFPLPTFDSDSIFNNHPLSSALNKGVGRSLKAEDLSHREAQLRSGLFSDSVTTNLASTHTSVATTDAHLTVSRTVSKEPAAILNDATDSDSLTGGSFSGGLLTSDVTDYPGYLLRYTPGRPLENRSGVAQWQAQMKKRGWNITVDGLFGPESERIAMLFQQEKGLGVDGIVGPQTWQAAFDESTLTPPVTAPVVEPVIVPAPTTVGGAYDGQLLRYSPLEPLQYDAQVEIVQQRLKSLGWRIEVDGLLGSRSAIAIEQFQKQVGLDADGIVGPLTWAVLFSEDAPAAPVQQNFDRAGGSGRINTAGLNLIKDFEGLRLSAYQDAVGVWTIGYGHTKTAYPGQRITYAQATELLRGDVATFENAVTRAVRVPITENQFAALVSFAYNVGSGALNSSTLLRRLNAGDTYGAANEFLRWNRAGGRVLAGLTRRREAERRLFLS